MVHIIWEFLVRPEHQIAFEAYYASEGHWARLFRHSPAYVTTTFAYDNDNPTRYLVTDVWHTLDAFRDFKQRYLAAYEQLDKTCEAFTLEEKYWGAFHVPKPTSDSSLSAAHSPA